MFYSIAKEHLNNYIDQVGYLIGKGDAIIEYCSFPLLKKEYAVSEDKQRELEKIIKNLETINEELNSILNRVKK